MPNSNTSYLKNRITMALLVPTLAVTSSLYGQNSPTRDMREKSAIEIQYSGVRTIDELLRESYPSVNDEIAENYPTVLEVQYKELNGQNANSKIKRGNWFKRNWEYFAWFGVGFGAGVGISKLIEALRDEGTTITVGRISVGPP